MVSAAGGHMVQLKGALMVKHHLHREVALPADKEL